MVFLHLHGVFEVKIFSAFGDIGYHGHNIHRRQASTGRAQRRKVAMGYSFLLFSFIPPFSLWEGITSFHSMIGWNGHKPIPGS